MAKANVKVHTSDGQPRPNVEPLAAIPTLPIYFTIGEGARVGVLFALGTALKNAGASTLNVISQGSSYPHSNVTQRINDLIAAANSLGVTPPLPSYLSLDYNGFVPAINAISAAVNGLPANTAAPVASATSLSVAGGGIASVTTGTWTGSPTYTYQWYRGGTAIAGATTNSHTLVAADVGLTLTCTVTGTNASGHVSATSNAVGPVTA